MKRLPLLLLLFLLTSCMVTKEQVGDYESMKGKEKVVLKDKEINLFWDKVSLQKIGPLDSLKTYEITKRRNAFGVVTYYGTFGIYSQYEVTVKTKKPGKRHIDQGR